MTFLTSFLKSLPVLVVIGLFLLLNDSTVKLSEESLHGSPVSASTGRIAAPLLRQSTDTIGVGVPFRVGASYTQGPVAAATLRLYQNDTIVQTVPVSSSVEFPYPSGLAAGAYVLKVAAVTTDGIESCSDGTCTNPYVTLTVGTVQQPAPAVTSITPNTGPTTGGTSVTIVGANFVVGAGHVYIGGAEASVSALEGSTTLRATTPAGTAGVVTVRVQNPDGQIGECVGCFTYTSPTPTCTYSLSASNVEIPATATTSQVNLQTQATCSWSASSSVLWLTVTPSNGVDSATLSVAAQANTGTSSRAGVVTVQGQTYTITQAGVPAPSLSVGYTLRGCTGIVTAAAAPDTRTGWGIQFRKHNADGTFTNFGTRDITPPYQRNPGTLAPGAHTFSGVWTRTSTPSVVAQPVTFVCN